jgi:hypothetical protein
MRKVAASVVVASAVMGLAVSQALAGAPKFFSANSSVSNDGELVVTFDERGLGNENVDYTITADADATYACINNGGKNPSAANKRSVEASVEANESFEPRNGRVAGRITAGPPSAGTFSCPGGQHLELLSVTYDHIVLTDTTNDVSTSVPDASGP